MLHQVREMGGLLVLSTNFQESRRIENQLKGRAGRQVCFASVRVIHPLPRCQPRVGNTA